MKIPPEYSEFCFFSVYSRGSISYAAGVFFIAAVKQKMKMKEIYLSKPPVDCCGDGEP